MKHVFGPVPSRRLGLSLGVDLIPPKTCTFDCLYCQVGRTTSKIIDPRPFVSAAAVLEEIGDKLAQTAPDVITLAGSGEPTLYGPIDAVIHGIKEITRTPVVLLTNGSLLWREDIRERVLEADIIMPTLCSAFGDTFRTIHRPHPDIEPEVVIEGYRRLRRAYQGRIFLEVVLLAGINDSEKEVRALRSAIRTIRPDRIQLNTVVRPPSDARAISLDREKLEDIKVFLGDTAEIIASSPAQAVRGERGRLIRDLLEMVARRPLRAADVESALGLSADAADDLIRGLLIKGYLSRQEHAGEVYYVSHGKET